MRVYKNEEMRWSMLRYDSRTFTAQQAKMLKGDVTRKEIPEKYIYIDDGCFRADGRKSSNMSTGQQKSPHFQRGLSGSCKNNKCIKNQDFLYLLGHSF